MIFLLSLLEVYKCCIYKVRMHIITVSVTFFSTKIQLLMILKKDLLTVLEKKGSILFLFFFGGGGAGGGGGGVGPVLGG